MLSKRDRDKRKDGDIYTVKVTVFPLNGSIGERKSKKDWERKSENNTFQSIFIIKTSLQSKSSWNKTKFNVWCDLPSQGIKVLLSFTVFQNIMAERTPNSSDALPIIGQHFLNASTKKTNGIAHDYWKITLVCITVKHAPLEKKGEIQVID